MVIALTPMVAYVGSPVEEYANQVVRSADENPDLSESQRGIARAVADQLEAAVPNGTRLGAYGERVRSVARWAQRVGRPTLWQRMKDCLCCCFNPSPAVSPIHRSWERGDLSQAER